MNQKKLYRSRSNRMICGVCGGLGTYLGIDATVVRVLWVKGASPMLDFQVSTIVFTVINLLVLYFILSVIIPEDDGIVD